MKGRAHLLAVVILCGAAAVLVLSAAAGLAGARVNTTKSIPVGLYWTSRDPVERGRYVQVCPPQLAVFVEAKMRGYIGSGFCPGNFGYLMKRVLAAKGDLVSVADEGVRVNGRLLPYSAPRRVDSAGRSLPRYRFDRYTLGAAEVLLMSDVSGTSFDGRYFGPVDRSHIRSVVRPVLTW